MKISGGRAVGGRLTATTRTMAPYGAAIKILADSMAEAFKGTGSEECEAVLKL